MFESYLKAQQLDRTMIKDRSDAGFNCYHGEPDSGYSKSNSGTFKLCNMFFTFFKTFLWKRPQNWWCIFHWHG